MFLSKPLLNFVIFYAVLVICSHGQSPQWWKSNFNRLKEKLCSKDDKGSSGNWAYIPEGIDAMRDVLPEICQHLNIHDLCSVSAVCKTLKEAADYEISKRSFEIHRIPIIKQNEGMPPETLQNILKIKPKLALFLTAGNTKSNYPLFYDSTSRELMAHYLPEVPKDCALFHLIGSIVKVNETNIEKNTNEALALFFHETEKIKIHYAALNLQPLGEYLGYLSVTNMFIKRAFLKSYMNQDRIFGSFTYILFSAQLPDYYQERLYGTHIVEKLAKKYNEDQNHFSLWGGKIMIMDSSVSVMYSTINFGASISGPGVRSWSLVIDTNDEESIIIEKITEFKRIIRLKSQKTIALCMRTILNTSSENLSNKNKLFSLLFPNLTIITYGISPKEMKYCLDSWVKRKQNISPRLEYGSNYVCYLVISYL